MSSPRISRHVHAMVDPDGAVLLDVKLGKYFSLNGIGAEIWRLLEAGRSPEEIEAQLAASYAAAPEVLRDDVATFLAYLTREQLLHVGN